MVGVAYEVLGVEPRPVAQRRISCGRDAVGADERPDPPRSELLTHHAVAGAKVEDCKIATLSTRVGGAHDQELGELARRRTLQPALHDLLIQTRKA
jgi:hypothetical protein